MFGLRKFLSVLLVLLLCPIVLGQIAAASARTLLRDSAFTKQVVRESGIYVEMESLLVGQLTEGLEDGEIAFTPAEMTSIVTGVLPAERIERLAEPLLEGFHGWFWSGAPRPELVLDLTDLRTTFPGVMRPIILAKIEALPVCSASQAAQLEASFKGGMAPCKSPNPDFNRRVVERAVSDAQLAKLIPGRVDLAAELERKNGPAFWTELKEQFGEVRTGLDLIPFGWGVIILLLALLAVLNLDRWYTPFGWMAAPLLVGGSIMLSVGALGMGFVQPIIQRAVVDDDAISTRALAGIQVAMHGLFGLMRNLSIGTVLLGIGCIVLVVVGHRRSPAGTGRRSGVA